MMNSTDKFLIPMNISLNMSNQFVQMDLSANVRLIRRLFHIIIFILFILILIFVKRKRYYSQMSNRPLSDLSYFIVSFGIIGLVLDDFLIINGITHQTWCSIHQISLHLLLIIVIIGRLLPDFYEYADRYYQYHDFATLKSGVLTSFIILFVVQLFISLKWLYYRSDIVHKEFNPPILCTGTIRPQIFLFILHLIELFIGIQSLHETTILNDNHSLSSSINPYLHELICQLNSILLRLFYFTTTSILQIFFIPGEFSASFYSSILIIEILLKYLINISYSIMRNERLLTNANHSNGILSRPHLSMKTDEFNDDTRLLNDID